MSAIDTRSPQTGLSWTSGQAIDCLLAPQQWCDHQWVYFTSTVDAENCFGDVMCRIALFVPLILATVFAALSRVVHGALTSCYMSSNPEPVTTLDVIDSAEPMAVPGTSEEIQIELKALEGKEAIAVKIGADRKVLINGNGVFTKEVFTGEKGDKFLECPVGVRRITVNEISSNDKYSRLFEFRFHDVVLDLSRDTVWEPNHFNVFRIRYRNYGREFVTPSRAQAVPYFRKRLSDQEVSVRFGNLACELGLDFVPLIVSNLGYLGIAFGLLGAEKKYTLYLTTAHHSRFCLVEAPVISRDDFCVNNRLGRVWFCDPTIVQDLHFSPQFWDLKSSKDLNRSAHATLYGGFQIESDLPESIIDGWKAIQTSLGTCITQQTKMANVCREIIVGYLFSSFYTPVTKNYELYEGRFRIEDAIGGMLELTEVGQLFAGCCVEKRCSLFISDFFHSFNLFNGNYFFSFKVLEKPFLIQISVQALEGQKASATCFVKFQIPGVMEFYTYCPQEIGSAEALEKLNQCRQRYPSFKITYACFQPELGVVAVVGHAPNSNQEKVYYWYPGQSNFQQDDLADIRRCIREGSFLGTKITPVHFAFSADGVIKTIDGLGVESIQIGS